MIPFSRTARAVSLLLVFVAWSSLAQGLRADYISVLAPLNQSNKLPDGVNYGTVVLEAYDGVGASGGGLSAGQVRLTFEADPLPYKSIAKNFGLHSVGFQTDLGFGAGSISTPKGWKLKQDQTLSEFGKFSWDATTSKDTLQKVVIEISGLGANATPGHFLLGDYFFAAHVKGFVVDGNRETTSHWVAANTFDDGPGGQGEDGRAPEPASFALALIGALGVGVYRRRKSRPTQN